MKYNGITLSDITGPELDYQLGPVQYLRHVLGACAHCAKRGR